MEINAVNRIAGKAALAVLKNVEVSRVESEPTADSEGQDALHVTIVLKRGADHEISGDDALNVMLEIQGDLLKAGESRFPIVDLFSEDELESDGNPQSQ